MSAESDAYKIRACVRRPRAAKDEPHQIFSAVQYADPIDEREHDRYVQETERHRHYLLGAKSGVSEYISEHQTDEERDKNSQRLFLMACPDQNIIDRGGNVAQYAGNASMYFRQLVQLLLRAWNDNA